MCPSQCICVLEEGVLRVSQSFSEFIRVFSGVLSVLLGRSLGVLRVLFVCSSGVLSVLLGCSSGGLRVVFGRSSGALRGSLGVLRAFLVYY